jgi:hypothetical protein
MKRGLRYNVWGWSFSGAKIILKDASVSLGEDDNRRGDGLQASVPDAWVGKKAAIQYKAYSYEEGQPWDAAFIQGTITDKNDLGLIVEVGRRGNPEPGSTMLITYDALLTVDV